MFSGLNLYTMASEPDGKKTFKGNVPVNRKQATASSSTPGNGQVVNSALKVTAGIGGQGLNSGSTGLTAVSKNSMVKLLDGFIVDDPQLKRALYEDIYQHDPIAGSAIDIFSSLPFSSFDLNGIEDEDVLETFQRSCDNIKPKQLIPGISREYLTSGVFIGTSLFDKVEKVFTSIMPQNVNDCKITPIPIYGVDPIIDLKIPQEMKKILKDKDPRLQKIMQDLPQSIRNDMNQGELKLPPETTIYMPRRTLINDWLGTSYLERMLPLHLLEKTLYRGTLDQANRRQRSILQIVAGDEEWIPPQEDLDAIRNLFQDADSDPTGAIIVTRPSINAQEIRSPTDFWRYDEMDQYFASAKYRALNISESLIIGEFSVSTLDATLSVLVDNFRAYREMLTSALFYDKIFPAIAIANDFKAEDYMVKSFKASQRSGEGKVFRLTVNGRTRNYMIKGTNYDTGKYAIPQIEWHKHLKPEGDTAYIELLSSLGDKGLPITMGMYAAAAGLNLDSILQSMDPDIDLRKKVAKYLKQVNKINSGIQPDMLGDGGDPDQQQQMQSAILAGLISKGSAKRRVGLLGREFDDRHRLHERKKNGSYRLTSRRRVREMTEQANKKIAEALANSARKENKRIRKGKERPVKILSSPIYGIVSNQGRK